MLEPFYDVVDFCDTPHLLFHLTLGNGQHLHLLSRFILCDLLHKVILIIPDISYDLLQVV